MRIAILTLPLHTNYGGILQAYALQTVLERMGHTVMVIFCRNIPRYYIYLSNLKTAVLRVLGNRNRKWKTYGKDKDAPVTYNFFREKINLTQPVYNVKSFLINKYRIDGIVVGSDQVWRPPYVRNIYTYYLNFAKKYPVKKIAYATSFGTSEWEYTKKEELKCSSLIPKFDKVTVREKEGITLCKEHFGIDASLVLDPTLLLEIEDYNELCKSVPSKQPFIGCYI